MSLMRLLGRLFGPSTTDELKYTCVCGEPMENTAVHTGTEAPSKQYRVETWQCTEECLHVGKVYRFEGEENENYGTGCLDGQVKP